jgi:rare lipoprotein A
VFFVVYSLLLAGCGHREARVSVPPPPSISGSEPQAGPANSEPTTAAAESAPPKEIAKAPIHQKPLLVETGLASWYGAPYNKRRGSNGEVYDMHALTAAHRTLPMGSVVRVTNVKTGRSAMVRITDRGPFIQGRILDLSEAAAKKVDVWSVGIAMVRIEVLQTPVPLNIAGRWAVQIGAFEKEHTADQLADRLSRRYQTAKVLCFSSPVGDWWVRVRVQGDDRQRAESIVRETHTSEGEIFLVRLD